MTRLKKGEKYEKSIEVNPGSTRVKGILTAVKTLSNAVQPRSQTQSMRVKAVVTSSLMSSGRQMGSGQIQFGSFDDVIADIMDDVGHVRRMRPLCGLGRVRPGQVDPVENT